MGGHAVRLIHDGYIPFHLLQQPHQTIIARNLVHAHNEVGVHIKGVLASGIIVGGIENLEVEVEFLGELVPPLLHQATRHHNDGTLTTGAQNKFLQIEAGHNGFSRAGVVGKQKPQRDSREQFLIHGPNLVRQRVDVGTIDGNHGIMAGSVGDAQGLGDEPEIVGVPVENRYISRFGNDFHSSETIRGEDNRRTTPSLITVKYLGGNIIESIHMFDSDRLVWNNAADPLATTQLVKGERRIILIHQPSVLTRDSRYHPSDNRHAKN